MPADSDCIRQALLDGLPEGAKLCVAFSGGRDSTVLLHALAGLRRERGFALRAVHVNHGLQPAGGDWALQCAAVARQLALPCQVLPVVVDAGGGKGVEAAAREARYAALRKALETGEWLLTAHHADDQLETVLMHLLRGSGVHGLAGIPRTADFGAGRLCRPLLHIAPDALDAYAAAFLAPAGLGWIRDPMNAEVAYDRGYIRHAVAPILRARFPSAARAVGRTAALAAEAVEVLDDVARHDAREAAAANRVSLAALARLSPARQRNLIRLLVRERGWKPPPERRLRAGLGQLLLATAGRQPVLAWAGHEIRRYREHLHLLDVAIAAPDHPEMPTKWVDGERLELKGVRGLLEFAPASTSARLNADLLEGGLEVAFRSGGERVRPGADRHHRTLKYLFQSRGVVPWMRGHVPLVLARGQLAAVADLWIADWAAAPTGAAGRRIVWTGHAPIW